MSNDAALTAVNIESGQALWEKSELAGLAAEDVHMVDGSLLMDLATGEQKFKDANESGKPLNQADYKAERYYLHHAVEGKTLYVFANRDHKLYAVDREAGTFHALCGEIKLQGGEDPNLETGAYALGSSSASTHCPKGFCVNAVIVPSSFRAKTARMAPFS